MMLTTENVSDRIIMSSFSTLLAGSIFASHFVSWHSVCRMCQSPELKPAALQSLILFTFLFLNNLPILLCDVHSEKDYHPRNAQL